MSVWASLKGKGASGFGYGSTAEQVTAGLDLSARTYLLTGVTTGIGAETMRVLCKRGARVIAAARTAERAQQAANRIGAERVDAVACELSEPSSVRECVAAVGELGHALDGIICNAGVMALAELQQSHGIEMQLMTNHVGHFLLVTGVLDRLTERGRVVVVASTAHRRAPAAGIELDNLGGERGYEPMRAYGQSKLANILFARELARRLEGTGKTANAVHPGVIRTSLFRHMSAVARVGLGLIGPVALKTISQGAATQCYVATHPDLEDVSGEYFADCNRSRTTPAGRDMELAARLWEATEEIVARTA
jgi:WW domain-containing oxidoreductase